MNILIIPSWYPSAAHPISGVFFYEQARIFAANFPEHNVIIAYVENDTPWKESWLRTNSLRVQKNQHGNFCEVKLAYYKKLPNYFYRYNSQQLTKRYKFLFALIIKEFRQIDIIHAQAMYPAGYQAYQLSKRYGIPYMVQEHMTESFMQQLAIMTSGKFNALALHILNNASGCLAVSSFLAKKLQAIVNYPVEIMPNFIADQNITPANNHPSTEFVFLCIASLIQRKGVDILIQAMGHLLQGGIKAKLLICGKGNLQAALTSQVSELNLTNNILFVGQVAREALGEYIQQCSAFVLPSRYETFGVVYLEAIAYGKPVIATRCGGPEDIVREGLNGYLVNCDDSIGLAAAMTKMVQKYPQFDAYTIRADYQQRFASHITCGKLLEFYKALTTKWLR